MLRDLIILNPGESRNQRIRLIEMAKIFIGDPSTIQKRNLMQFTGTIQKTRMMNRSNKKKEKRSPQKGQTPDWK